MLDKMTTMDFNCAFKGRKLSFPDYDQETLLFFSRIFYRRHHPDQNPDMLDDEAVKVMSTNYVRHNLTPYDEILDVYHHDLTYEQRVELKKSYNQQIWNKYPFLKPTN
jgi:hypothetical protein